MLRYIESYPPLQYRFLSIYRHGQVCLAGQFLPRCMECRRGLAMGILSVRLSVCPSVCQTRALWQNGKKAMLDFYIIRKNIYPSFLRRRMVGGGDPFYLKSWVNRRALERNRRFWTDNRSYSASAVRPSEKSSINTNRTSPTRFPTSLRWSSYVAPKSPKGGGAQKRIIIIIIIIIYRFLERHKSLGYIGRFPSTIALRLKKVCYKVSLCENCQRQSCRAFIGLTIRAKMIGRGRPLKRKFCIK